MSGFWMRMLFGSIAGFVGAIVMVVSAILSVYLWQHYIGMPHGLPSNFLFVPAFAIIALIGVGLVFATDNKYGTRAAQLGIAVLVCGVLAAMFRSIDPLTCRAVPFGTHFLWHILLSAAAYLGIRMLVRMKTHGRAVFG
jgi:branched-subunit amino acid transport protein